MSVVDEPRSYGYSEKKNNVKHCVAGALASGDEADAATKIDELLAAVRRFTKTR